MIHGKNFLDQSVKDDLRTFDIFQIATGQGDDYTTGFLLDYLYFKKHRKMMAIDLSKKQAFDVDRKAI